MKQTTKRVLSLLMALTMLIGMMTAVTVSAAETGEWKLVKGPFTFEDGSFAGLAQVASNEDRTIEIITDPLTGSQAIRVAFKTTSNTRLFNVTGIELKTGDILKVEFDVRGEFDPASTKDKDMTVFLAGGVGEYAYFTPRPGVNGSWQTISRETTIAEKNLLTSPYTKGEFGLQINGLEAGDEVWIDNIKIYKKIIPKAPVVESVVIDGVTQIGQTLTATAVVSDENEDDIATASYQWQVKIEDAWKDITDATSKTYVITEKATVDGENVDMLGKQVRVVATPLSDNDNDPAGTPVPSEPTQAIIEATIPPSGTGQKIEGTFEVGQDLTASFTYEPSADNISQGNTVYIWEISSDNTSFTPVQSSTSNKYTIRSGDAGKWLRVRIIPKDKNGLPGEELVVSATKIEGVIVFYVSTEGDDSNIGSMNKPFKTIQKARDVIREFDGNLPAGGVVVNIMGGTYSVSDTIAFTEEDSGTEESPIVYQAYNGETVTFTGGRTLDSSKIEKVTDSDLLNRLVEKDAQAHLYMLDLGAQNVEMDALQPYGDGFNRALTGYRPKRIYMNNQLLTDARWPNDDQSQNMVKCTPLTATDGIDVNTVNTQDAIIQYKYPDSENRSEKWDIEEGDAYVGGAVVYYWAPVCLRIKNIDTENKIVTSLDASHYSPLSTSLAAHSAVYFSNIFAEIDKPGESYVDRENNILYFYPIGPVENADMVVSILKKNMITLTDVSNVTFKGIGFKNTVETAVIMKNCDRVTIADGEISNITQGGVKMTNCTNTIIEGCNFYTIGANAMDIIGDDAVLKASTADKATTIPENRKNLTSSGNEIRYNNFHNINIFPDYKNATLYISYAVGEWIHHNEFNELDFYTVRIQESNDILIEYNKMLNLGEANADAGAINWGREIDSLGHTVRYNYFENIGSKLVANHLDGYQSVSIFTDDASTGGNIYGNVFLNGGSNQNGVGSATVGNGPEFSNVWGNISICTDFDRMNRSFLMRNWGDTAGMTNLYGVTVPKGTAVGSWVYHMGMREAYGDNASSDAMKQADKELVWSEKWIQHYAGSQWAGALEHYGKENYESAKALYDAENYAGVLTFLGENLTHERTNKIHDNVSLGATTMDSLADHYQNYNGTQHEITAADKALFVDFDNKDFTLTPEGLAKIQAKAPEFEAIPFNQIGLGNKAVGGHKPVVTVNREVYTATADGFGISPSYTFADADGDLEGTTKIYWYVSDTEDGKYEQIYGGAEGNSFEVTEEYLGKFLKYEIVPFDTTSLRGEPVWSDPISVRKVTVTTEMGENGKLTKNEKEVLAEENVVASGTYTYKVVPDSGYQADSVVVESGGNTISPTLNAENEFEITVSEDTTITVTFCENPDPTIVTESRILSDTVTTGETEYQAYLAFATVTNSDKVNGYGMYLKFPGGQIKLEGLTDEATMEMLKNCNGKFAFRVFGEAMKGQTITLLPYITVGEEESLGDETTDLVYDE